MSTARCMRLAGQGMASVLIVAVASYGAYVGITWFGYGHVKAPAKEEIDPLLDRFMPNYDVAERRFIRVAAPAEITLSAAYNLNLQQSAVIRAIFRAREVILGSQPGERVLPQPLLEQMKALGWSVLAEIPGREIVVGAVTQPWMPNVVFRGLPPDEFAAFNEPGYVKIAWTLRAESMGPSASVARHETRAVATDPVAAARFRWYWSRLSPGIKVIRYIALGLVKSAAERHARQTGHDQPLVHEPSNTVTYAR